MVRGTIKVSGSGTALPLIKVLESDFTKLHPGIRIAFLPGVHSGGGIKGVANGTLDVGTISRELKTEERKLRLACYWLSEDALAVAVHKDMPIRRITTSQLKAIYEGKIVNWKELGGPDGPIVVLDRNEDESAKIVFREFVLGKDLKIAKGASNLYYESDMVDGLVGTPGALGYFSYGFAVSKKVPVRLLALDGVSPSVENVQNDTYKMTRGLGIVTKRKTSPVTEEFVDYLTSRRAAGVMARFGFAPYSR